MLTVFRSLFVVAAICSFLLPGAARAEQLNPDLFDKLANGTLRQEFVNITTEASKTLPCGKIFITSVSCEGSARIFSTEGRPAMPENMGARVWFGGQVVAMVSLARNGMLADQPDTAYTGFAGMQAFANPIFLNTTGVNCNNRVISKSSLSVESPNLYVATNPSLACYVGYYRS